MTIPPEPRSNQTDGGEAPTDHENEPATQRNPGQTQNQGQGQEDRQDARQAGPAQRQQTASRR
jgi:hypothetical protein